MGSANFRTRNSARIARLACALAASVALSACAPMQPAGKCDAAGCPNDAAMVDKITTALRAAPGIEFWSVDVQYRNDVVYLYGLVATSPERSDIEQIARGASGGKKVVNSIEVRGARS